MTAGHMSAKGGYIRVRTPGGKLVSQAHVFINTSFQLNSVESTENLLFFCFNAKH